MKNILFICTGNTCRSCMAEAIFNHFCNSDGFKALSAGIAVANGSKVSSNSAAVIKQNLNEDISSRKAVMLTYSLIENCELVLAMTLSIKYILYNRYAQFKSKIFTLNEYVSLDNDIMDPFGSSIETYKQTYGQLVYSIKLLLQKLKGDTSIY